VASTAVLKEYKAHSTKIHQIRYTPDGKWLITASAESLCIVDALHEYQPVKVMHYTSKCKFISFTISPNSKLLAAIGPASNVCHVYETDTFEEKHSFETASSDYFSHICFSTNSREILACTTDSRILRINVAMSSIVKEMCCDIPIQYATISPNGKYVLIGSESNLKIFDYELSGGSQVSNSIIFCNLVIKHSILSQSFTGHALNVNACTFSNNSQFVLSVGNDALLLWRFHGDIIGDFNALMDNYLERKIDEQETQFKELTDSPIPSLKPVLKKVKLNLDDKIKELRKPQHEEAPILSLTQLVGYDSLPNSCLWCVRDGTFLYPHQQWIIVEDIEKGTQSHLNQDSVVTCLGLHPNNSIVAVASQPTTETKQADISIWDYIRKTKLGVSISIIYL